MVSVHREDIYRSMLAAFTGAATITGETVTLTGLKEETMDQSEWYHFQFLTLIPRRTRSDHLLADGMIRVVCNSRSPAGSTIDIATPYAMADRVVAALERRTVAIQNYSAGDGLTRVGSAFLQEAQIDDLNDEASGVRPLIVTFEYLLTAEN